MPGKTGQRSYYLGKMEELREQFGGKCVWAGVKDKGVCSSPERLLEFCHKVPTGSCGRGRGRADRYHDIKRHPECYQLMCRRHHVLFDADYWSRRAIERLEWKERVRTGTLPEKPPF
jgi:hypothetical protein